MTPERFRECLAIMRWMVKDVVDILGRPRNTIRRWESGTYPVPDDVAKWLEAQVRFFLRNPPPAYVPARPWSLRDA